MTESTLPKTNQTNIALWLKSRRVSKKLIPVPNSSACCLEDLEKVHLCAVFSAVCRDDTASQSDSEHHWLLNWETNLPGVLPQWFLVHAAEWSWSLQIGFLWDETKPKEKLQNYFIISSICNSTHTPPYFQSETSNQHTQKGGLWAVSTSCLRDPAALDGPCHSLVCIPSAACRHSKMQSTQCEGAPAALQGISPISC